MFTEDYQFQFGNQTNAEPEVRMWSCPPINSNGVRTLVGLVDQDNNGVFEKLYRNDLWMTPSNTQVRLDSVAINTHTGRYVRCFVHLATMTTNSMISFPSFMDDDWGTVTSTLDRAMILTSTELNLPHLENTSNDVHIILPPTAVTNINDITIKGELEFVSSDIEPTTITLTELPSYCEECLRLHPRIEIGNGNAMGLLPNDTANFLGKDGVINVIFSDDSSGHYNEPTRSLLYRKRWFKDIPAYGDEWNMTSVASSPYSECTDKGWYDVVFCRRYTVKLDGQNHTGYANGTTKHEGVVEVTKKSADPEEEIENDGFPFSDTDNFRQNGWSITENMFTGASVDGNRIYWDQCFQPPNSAEKSITIAQSELSTPIYLTYDYAISNNRLSVSVNGNTLASYVNNDSTDFPVLNTANHDITSFVSSNGTVTIRFVNEYVYQWFNHTKLDDISVSH